MPCQEWLQMACLCHAMPRVAANGMPLRANVYAICDAFIQGCTATNAFKRIHGQIRSPFCRTLPRIEPSIVNIIYITICSTFLSRGALCVRRRS